MILNRIAKDHLDPKLVLEKLEEVEKETKKAKGGIRSEFAFNGAKRIEYADQIQAIAGRELGVFSDMEGLNRSGDWTALLELADKQIKETPDWPTPYFFSGLANAKLGHSQLAVDRLQHFLLDADHRPDYQDAVKSATDLLSKLRAHP